MNKILNPGNIIFLGLILLMLAIGFGGSMLLSKDKLDDLAVNGQLTEAVIVEKLTNDKRFPDHLLTYKFESGNVMTEEVSLDNFNRLNPGDTVTICYTDRSFSVSFDKCGDS